MIGPLSFASNNGLGNGGLIKFVASSKRNRHIGPQIEDGQFACKFFAGASDGVNMWAACIDFHWSIHFRFETKRLEYELKENLFHGASSHQSLDK